MHDQTTDMPTPHPWPDEVGCALGHPGGISLDEVTARVEGASGADAAAAIAALETIAANLRNARNARAQLAARVPPEMLRQVLLARARTGLSEAEPS